MSSATDQELERPTLADVARDAGVSITTVSLVLNGKGRISAPVREKIMASARRLGYRNELSSPYAVKQRIRPLAALVYQDPLKAFEWGFVRGILQAIEDAIRGHAYSMVMIPVRYDSNPRYLFTNLLTVKAGGVFSVHYQNPELFERLERHGIPVVLVNNSNFQDRLFTVCTDDFQAAYEGVRHLLNLGHREIAYASYSLPDISTFLDDSLIGFRKAMGELGLAVPASRLLRMDLYDNAGILSALRRLFAQAPVPTAIYALDDYLAAKILALLGRLGLSVPRDVSIIAAGDTLDYENPYVPQITTMRVDRDALGSFSGDLMVRRLKKQRSELQVLNIKQHLVERGSCQRRDAHGP
jgi:LacI family transcriptional regulator